MYIPNEFIFGECLVNIWCLAIYDDHGMVYRYTAYNSEKDVDNVLQRWSQEHWAYEYLPSMQAVNDLFTADIHLRYMKRHLVLE